MSPILPYLAAPAAAFLAAAINSVAGGGTFLSFPTLTGVVGLSEKAANMTSTLGLWPGSAASILEARKELSHIPRRLLLVLSLISLLGGTVGSLLLIGTSNHTFRLVIPWLLLLATATFAFAKPIARWAGHKHGDTSLKWRLLVGVVQFAVAVYGGYFGAGIGVLMLAGLAFTGLPSLHQINALKVTLATIINGIAVLLFAANSLLGQADSVHWPTVLLMVPLASLGGFLGMKFARALHPSLLRLLILLTGISLTTIYFYKAYAP